MFSSCQLGVRGGTVDTVAQPATRPTRSPIARDQQEAAAVRPTLSRECSRVEHRTVLECTVREYDYE